MKQPHTELKKRIADRAKNTGEIVPETGDRVPYIIRAGMLKQKISELSEDPIIAERQGKHTKKLLLLPLMSFVFAFNKLLLFSILTASLF